MLAEPLNPIPVLKPNLTNLCLPAHLAVVFAAKNEARTIAKRVQEVIAAGNAAIVVDESSSDSTPEAAASAGAWVIRAGYNLSFSSAIQQGVRLAAKLGERVLVTRA